MKVAVLYTFHIVKPQLAHYINSTFKADDVDFYLIPCGLDISSVQIPDYVKVIKRRNQGYDFGAWSDAILDNDLYKDYTHFIFINSSVSGPFTPPYHSGRWTDVFITPLNDELRLFGTTINCCHNPGKLAHVQSFVFSMERRTVEFLIEKHVFTQQSYCVSMMQAISTKEVRMSREIIKAGWNIGCLLQCFRDVDFRTVTAVVENNDVCYKGAYFGQTTHPYEVVFVKSNRGQDLKWLKMYEV